MKAASSTTPIPIQAHLFAHELTLKRAADDPGKLTRALVEARVDLNPHQVDAALFAFKNPLSKGAILADEVGLGKTIEAGLVATQHWAEGRRRVLVLCPASLRTQWRDELGEKFLLPSVILDSRAIKGWPEDVNPFDRGGTDATVVVASYHFGARHQEDLMTVPWDLAILDEAHRLRNVYKEAKIALAIRSALQTTPKMLLTATPLQNSLSDLYGLVSFIDDSAFGDSRTFARKYSRVGEDGNRFEELKARLQPLCHRTLRRQVVEYVSYTERKPLTQEFSPSEEEQVLYDLVSEYLRRDELAALPYAQRALITLVLRKLLASSTFAIAGALDTMVRRLEKELREGEALLAAEVAPQRNTDEDEADLVEELVDDELDGALSSDDLDEMAEPEPPPEPVTRMQLEVIAAEITELESFRDLAQAITALTDAQVHRLMELPATDEPGDDGSLSDAVAQRLQGLEDDLLKAFAERKAEWLGDEYEKLDRWAQDERERMRADVADLDRQIKECARATRLAGTEPERLPLRRKKLHLERQLETARRDFDAAADGILERQETMLNQIEASLTSDHTREALFTTSWSVR